MSNTQAFLLGVMAAWTPSLVILAWLLRVGMLDERERMFDERESMFGDY
jgi:hypothetical protein